MSALITDYPGLRAAIDQRRKELGLSMLALDELAGLQSGYSAKILCGIKNLGPISLECMLGALGMAIVLSPAKHVEFGSAAATSRLNLKLIMAKRGAKGGRVTARAMSPKQRYRRAKKAAQTRWERARLAKVASRERERQGKRDVAE